MGIFSSSGSSLPALETVSDASVDRMMGTWFVIAVKPTAFETKNSNAVERYTWRHTTTASKQQQQHDFDIDFSYNVDLDPFTSKLKTLPQKGWIDDSKTKRTTVTTDRQETRTGNWKVSPLWPIKLSYLLLEVDLDQYHYCVVGYPSRAYCWIMCRTPHMDDTLYNELLQKLQDKHQYDLAGLRRVPQQWTAAERERRQLVKEIPNHMLLSETTTTTS